MQRQPVEAEGLAAVPVVLALAVVGVAHDRVAQVREVAPYLVETARLGEGAHQRVPRLAERRRGLDRRDPHEAGDGRHARPALVGRNGVVDAHLVGGDAADQREVRLLDEAALERAGEEPCRVRARGEEQRAARRSIEAMHGVQIAAPSGAQPIDDRVALAAETAVHDEPRGLGDRHEALASREDLEREGGHAGRGRTEATEPLITRSLRSGTDCFLWGLASRRVFVWPANAATGGGAVGRPEDEGLASVEVPTTCETPLRRGRGAHLRRHLDADHADQRPRRRLA